MKKTALLFTVFTLLAVGCGGGRGGQEREPAPAAQGDLSGRIQADGSSTVGPFTTLAAERFRSEEPGVRITVGISGTGGGFERFCRGETDLSNASRPIKDEEKAICEQRGVDYLEFQVANDALTVVVNPQNDWADCLTADQLKAIWEPGSKIDSWSEIPGSDFPDVPLRLSGAGTDSGTFDYFTDAILGEEGASRSDYSASEDDNVTVQAVRGDRGGLGYFGFSYYDENADSLKALAVDGGDGCVEPSVETAQSGEYTPLSRPLFIYAKTESFARPEVEAFIRFALANAQEIAEGALFVPLTDEQQRRALDDFEAAAG
jgi:phosphate transport system substrate-binding protein